MPNLTVVLAAITIVTFGATAHATSDQAFALDHVTFRAAAAPATTVIEDAAPPGGLRHRDLSPINVGPADLPQVSRYTELLNDSRYFAAIPSLPSYYEQTHSY